jgi:8-hydroxy-5-deazaflavin:NADPH oxidoreductase
MTSTTGKMKIGIIGAGQVGGALVRQYTKAGHQVKMANASGVEKLKILASETGASPDTLENVVTGVDVIVISIPQVAITELSPRLFKNLSASTTIIDTGNYYPIRDGKLNDLEDGMVESVWVSNHLQRPVVKAYNSILAESLVASSLSKGSTSRIALPISGDDKQSKALVSILINDSGFDSVDIGSLQDSWRQQPGSPVYCTDLSLPQLIKSVKTARKELLAERRELGLQYLLSHDPSAWRETVNNNRKIYESVLET